MITTADYIKRLSAVSNCHSLRDVFSDVCRMYAVALHNSCCLDAAYVADLEREFAVLRKKYGEAGYAVITETFAMVAQALEAKREDFLGHVLEELNCNNKNFGQFFTPTAVSRVMARISSEGLDGGHKDGEIVRVNDPACGAGVLLIEQGEEMLARGFHQRDILILAEDLDGLACAIAYTQLTLLGYAAVVTHKDTLTNHNVERPWYTAGYFLHGMPMRGVRVASGCAVAGAEEPKQEATEASGALVQMDLFGNGDTKCE